MDIDIAVPSQDGLPVTGQREINADDSIFSQELPRRQTCQKAIYTL